MADKQQESDKVSEKTKAADKPGEQAQQEATRHADEQVMRQRKERAYQKDPDRPPLPTSAQFGRPEILDGDDVVLKGHQKLDGGKESDSGAQREKRTQPRNEQLRWQQELADTGKTENLLSSVFKLEGKDADSRAELSCSKSSGELKYL